jgi:hypothetical protein
MCWDARPLSSWLGTYTVWATVITLLSLLWTGPAAAEKRVALVVGNSAYQNITRLDNPRNDATLMAETLSSLGFSLIGGAPRSISTKRPSTPMSKISDGKFRGRTLRYSIMPVTAYR